jgi:hypothetical protein
MMQTKKQSFIESLTNTAIGFTISFISTFGIFPLVGLHTSAQQNLLITVYFTLISILRGYVIRRWFNKKAKPERIIPHSYLYCFECEIETPIYEKNDEAICSNCGLIH